MFRVRNSYFGSTEMNRAFSAGDLRCMNSWGDAPGWNETAPVALTDSAFILCEEQPSD